MASGLLPSLESVEREWVGSGGEWEPIQMADEIGRMKQAGGEKLEEGGR